MQEEGARQPHAKPITVQILGEGWLHKGKHLQEGQDVYYAHFLPDYNI
jgi:hypothetical protein